MKTERINIYISDRVKKKLCQYCKKHHISFSTLIEIMCMTYQFYGIFDKIKETYLTDYIDKKWQKTSVKPKEPPLLKDYKHEEKSRIYSNLIYLFFEKKTTKYIAEEQDKKAREVINKQVQERYDQYANYNEYLRNTTRALKNKSIRAYFKRKIEIAENK